MTLNFKQNWRNIGEKLDETDDKKHGTEQSISDSEVAIEEMGGFIAKPADGMRMIERKCWPGAVQKDIAKFWSKLYGD